MLIFSIKLRLFVVNNLLMRVSPVYQFITELLPLIHSNLVSRISPKLYKSYSLETWKVGINK